MCGRFVGYERIDERERFSEVKEGKRCGINDILASPLLSTIPRLLTVGTIKSIFVDTPTIRIFDLALALLVSTKVRLY